MIEKQMLSGGEETKKLYYEDSHRKEFTATVLSCEERLTAKGKKDGYVVVLDQTALFPEGGGQFGDRGWIDDVEVYDTHEKGGVILHCFIDVILIDSLSIAIFRTKLGCTIL